MRFSRLRFFIRAFPCFWEHADRSYICYKRLAMSVDAGVLKSFVASIIDSIIILDGKVKTIVFRNGLSHTFIFRDTE